MSTRVVLGGLEGPRCLYLLLVLGMVGSSSTTHLLKKTLCEMHIHNFENEKHDHSCVFCKSEERK